MYFPMFLLAFVTASRNLFDFWGCLRISRICGWTSLLYEVPGGDQDDGLPPVASTSESKLPYCVFGEEYPRRV